MPYEDLLRQRRLKRQPSTPRAIDDLLSLARRDASVAASTLGIDPDWAFSIAYNAVLQASRAFVLKEGFRPRGAEQHLTIIRFLKEALGDSLADEIAAVDQMRRKRHRAVYETAGRIGAAEAEQAVAFANDYLAKIRGLIRQP